LTQISEHSLFRRHFVTSQHLAPLNIQTFILSSSNAVHQTSSPKHLFPTTNGTQFPYLCASFSKIWEKIIQNKPFGCQIFQAPILDIRFFGLLFASPLAFF